MLLSLKNISFGWDEDLLFDNISCQLNEGDFVRLTGENGIGKSTLLSLAAGMIPHFNRGKILTGEILFQNLSLTKYPPKTFFPKIAFFSSANLDFFLLTENLTQEMLLAQSLVGLSSDEINQKTDLFRVFFPIILELQTKNFHNMNIHEKALTLLFIYYLQNARLFLIDELLNNFEADLKDKLNQFLIFLTEQKNAVIVVDHHSGFPYQIEWRLNHRKLLIK